MLFWEGENDLTSRGLHGGGAPSVALTAWEPLVVTSALRESVSYTHLTLPTILRV